MLCDECGQSLCPECGGTGLYDRLEFQFRKGIVDGQVAVVTPEFGVSGFSDQQLIASTCGLCSGKGHLGK